MNTLQERFPIGTELYSYELIDGEVYIEKWTVTHHLDSKWASIDTDWDGNCFGYGKWVNEKQLIQFSKTEDEARRKAEQMEQEEGK